MRQLVAASTACFERRISLPGSKYMLKNRRILAVENDYFSAMDLKHWLLAARDDVLGPVPSVEQGLALIEAEGAPDMAVLDIHLGRGEMVYPIAARLRELSVPFVFMSGEPTLHPNFQDRPRIDKCFGERGLLHALHRLAAAGN
jgi:CheY-like chemotaxis protein